MQRSSRRTPRQESHGSQQEHARNKSRHTGVSPDTIFDDLHRQRKRDPCDICNDGYQGQGLTTPERRPLTALEFLHARPLSLEVNAAFRFRFLSMTLGELSQDAGLGILYIVTEMESFRLDKSVPLQLAFSWPECLLRDCHERRLLWLDRWRGG